MSHFNLPLYQDLRRAGMPRNIAHAMASVDQPTATPAEESAPSRPEPTATVSKIEIPEDQDVTVAADDLADKLNEVIDALHLDQE